MAGSEEGGSRRGKKACADADDTTTLRSGEACGQSSTRTRPERRVAAAAKPPLVDVTADFSAGDTWPLEAQGSPGLSVEPKPGTRYVDLGLIGEGGMGEVRRVLDRELNRTMAMKILRPELGTGEANVARFVEEAQATAQLQHPGIVPVNELGRLPDGRFYFTMQEVKGRTLEEVITELHAASGGGHWGETASGWTFRRLVAAFHKACTAVAYAHSRGVVHRDLKPSNIMVGAFGAVLVMDWGLAKILVGGTFPDAVADEPTVVTCRSQDEDTMTRAGVIAGTPAYMAPEQARGEIRELGPRTDVYALGAILYQVLTGRPPYRGSGIDVLMQVRDRSPVPPRLVASSPGLASVERCEQTGEEPTAAVIGRGPSPVPPPIPGELEAICLKAMARTPAERYRDAAGVAEAVGAWLENARRRERALELVRKAKEHVPEIGTLRSRARELREQARRRLAAVRSYQPVADKVPGWELEDQARRLEQDAALEEIRYVQTLLAALTIQGDLPEAMESLADHYHDRHREAENARDIEAAGEAELQLRWYDRGRYAVYLKGDGALTLVTRPEGANVQLFQFRTHERRLIPVFVKELGRTPLRAVSLPRGSYLLRISAPGRDVVTYPVLIERGEHWEGIRPGDRDPFPVPLPREGALTPDEVYVPPGWFQAGGDGEAFNSPSRTRLWVDGFVIGRYPVTNREYLAFLNDLVAGGREDRALTLAPRERGGTADEPSAIIYGRRDDGRFCLRPDAEGDIWLPDWPVVMIDWYSATAYAAEQAARTGIPWRLPSEWEWEKAARGTDGRFFPWGDFADPTWARIMDSRPGRPGPAPIHEYPVDESPYGVRGMAGNVRDWCLEIFRDDLPDPRSPLNAGSATPDSSDLCVSRGGSWIGTLRTLRTACRNAFFPLVRYGDFGFRLVRPFGS